jgi:arsenite methyltransferase
MGQDLRNVVRQKYGEAALRVSGGEKAGCCGSSCGSGGGIGAADPITRDLYDSVTTASLPEEAVLASLGCGNPTALAELKEGEVVLDLGSGGGIDVLLSAKRVGPTGKAYGLDMTDEMLALARRNAEAAGATNRSGAHVAGGAAGPVWEGGSVEFLRGEIEAIPLPDASVDVIISNCVINLSADKRQVLREAYRVLKPGGRFAVSDVVIRGPVPEEVRRSMELWVGCVAGALDEREFESLLREVGFEDPSLEPTRVYDVEDARAFLEAGGLDVDAFTSAVAGRVLSAFVRARKPMSARAPARTLPLAAVTAAARTPIGEEQVEDMPLAEPKAHACCGPECCA